MLVNIDNITLTAKLETPEKIEHAITIKKQPINGFMKRGAIPFILIFLSTLNNNNMSISKPLKAVEIAAPTAAKYGINIAFKITLATAVIQQTIM